MCQGGCNAIHLENNGLLLSAVQVFLGEIVRKKRLTSSVLLLFFPFKVNLNEQVWI